MSTRIHRITRDQIRTRLRRLNIERSLNHPARVTPAFVNGAFNYGEHMVIQEVTVYLFFPRNRVRKCGSCADDIAAFPFTS